MLMEKAIEMFLENCKALDRSPNTIAKYKKSLEKFDLYLSSKYNRPVYAEEVKADDLEQFLFQEFNPTKYSSSTRHNVVTAFRALYSYLNRKRVCENTGKLIQHEKVETKERDTVSEIEFRKIVQQVNSPTAKAVIYTLYYAGLRVNEAVSIKIEDVDLEEDVLHVRDTKNGLDRVVPINTRLKKVLETYFKDERMDFKTDNFFSTFPKGQITAQHVNKQIKKAIEKVALEKKISSHNLRHSFASALIKRGVDLVTLRTLLGHKNIRTTSIYCHTSIDELAEAVNVL